MLFGKLFCSAHLSTETDLEVFDLQAINESFFVTLETLNPSITQSNIHTAR